MIRNDTIVNADINSSAAIAGTKISPDFGSQTVQTTGVVSHALGTAGAPTLTFTGDTNTGIYSPGADQVAISTNGTGRLFVDASGRVGVGTTSNRDSTKLDVLGDITFGGNASYYGTIGYNAGTGHLEFTSGDGSFKWIRRSGLATSMVLDSSGRLGIGTSSPTSILHLATGAGVSSELRFSNAANNWSVKTGTSANSFSIVENQFGGTPLFIDSALRVGIGTTIPATNLEVRGGGAGVDAITTISSIQNGAFVRFAPAGSNAIRQYTIGSAVGGSLIFYDDTANSQRAAIDSSGRLLVGTSSNLTSDPVQISFSQADSLGGLSITNQQWYGYGARILFQSKNNSAGDIKTLGAITGEGDGADKGRLVFSVTRDGSASPTEAYRISNTGLSNVFSSTNVFISSTSQGAGTSTRFYSGRHSATGADASGTETFLVWSNGNVQNTNASYGAISDAKLKENIADATSQWGDIKALQVRKYNFKAETGYETHTQIGLVAQEVELVSPGLVSESPDRDAEGNDLGTVTKSVNYSVLYMKAVKALQEAMERIETLEAKVAALESA
jgi:hypothetical protein